MARAIVSAKYHVEIPRDVRQEAGLERGQVLQALAKGAVILLVPDRPLETLRGFVRGIATEGFRDEPDRN